MRCSGAVFFDRYCTAVPSASIYPSDYQIVAIIRALFSSGVPAEIFFLPNLFSLSANPLFPGQPRWLPVLASCTVLRRVSRKRPAYRLLPPAVSRESLPPSIPLPPEACCCPGAAVVQSLPRLAAIRVSLFPESRCLPGTSPSPVPLPPPRSPVCRIAASTSRSLSDTGCLHGSDNLLFGGFLCTFAPQTESS